HFCLLRRSEILPPWYPPFRQNEALNRALGLAASHTLSAPFPCMCPVHPHMSAGRDFFFMRSKSEQPFLAAGLAFGREHPVPGGVQGGGQLRLAQRLLREDDALPLFVGGGHLLHPEGPPDRVVDMGLTHAAGHAVDLCRRLVHCSLLFRAGQPSATSKTIMRVKPSAKARGPA